MLPGLIDPLVDGELSVRPFEPTDAATLIAGRDAEFVRFLGEGSPSPQPVGSIWVADTIVGWIDYDRDDRAWLADDEVNVGYNVFAAFRGRRYGARALRLVREHLVRSEPPYVATVLIDPANEASLSVATRAGLRLVRHVDGDVFMR